VTKPGFCATFSKNYSCNLASGEAFCASFTGDGQALSGGLRIHNRAVARILVIDDNRDIRDLLRFILEGEGHSVEVAADGEQGLRQQSACAAELVITDIFMPNRDGLETLGRLRVEHPQAKVLVISGGGTVLRGGTSYLATARQIGAHAVLPKPFEHQALIETVRSLLAPEAQEPAT